MFHRFVVIVSVIIFVVVSFVTSSPRVALTGIMPCLNDDDCSSFKNSTCVKPACMCNGSRLCSLTVIKVVTEIGEKCETSNECNINFAECRNSRCECKEEYIESTDGKNCLIVSKGIDGSCDDNAQCYTKAPNSVCRNNKCICEGEHIYPGLCDKIVGLGGSCESDPECSIVQSSKCLNSVCRCVDGFVATKDGKRCLIAAEGNNSDCVDTVQCKATLGEYSHCIDGVCRCKELYHYKDRINKCIKDRLLGDTCTVHSDCHDLYPEKQERLECVAGVCACRSFLEEYKGMCIDGIKSSSSRTLAKILVYPVLFTINYYFIQ